MHLLLSMMKFVLLALFFLGVDHIRATEEAEVFPNGGLVSVRRTVDTSILEHANSSCQFAGTIVFGGPSSLEQSDTYYFLSHRQLLAYQLVVDAVNLYRCGVKIGGQHFKIDLQTYDDQSSTTITTAIGEKLVNAPYSSLTSQATNSQQSIDLIVAGFSSGMTEPLADAVADHNLNATSVAQQRLMLAGGSSVTSIFANRSNIFTTTPPVASFMRPAIQGLSEKTTAKTVATLWEDVGLSLIHI